MSPRNRVIAPWLALVVIALAWPHTAHADDDPYNDEAASDGDEQFDAIMAPQNQPSEPGASSSVTPWDESEDGTVAVVRVPLRAFARVWNSVRAAASRARPTREGPAVVLGEAHYSGRAIKGALELNVRLGVTLGRPDQWKIVPLIGEDVVLARATVAGQPIAISTLHGYQVWMTRQTGEIAIELTILVPARGPRGSIEYDFRIARTPVTRFDCRFPMAGLEPRLDAAVESSVDSQDGETVLTAVIRPTTRIHMVGFRDMGESQAGNARVYVQTLNLLSVDETSLELFSVLRYTILYAGTKEFLIHIPDGVKVVSAEGRGAFRYAIEQRDNGSLLRGETAFPIRDNYEISLRLEREMSKSQAAFEVPLPTSQGVEREVGWLAVEVPGKTRLEEDSRADMTAIDTRQLPPELVRSAVSPILRAYRYHDASTRRLGLVATRLPEQETASETVDHVRAFSVVSTEGDVLTELRLKLRNRLRHSIALDIAADTRVRSVLLDGRPAKPSRDASGQLILPLKRSAGTGMGLTPIMVQVVLESRVSELDWLGKPQLSLPAVDLPVSSLAWSVFVPANNLYSAPAGDISAQSYVGRARWRDPVARRYDEPDGAAGVTGSDGAPAGSAYTGAMPVRITVPKSGVRLEYERYWLDTGHPAAISFTYVRRWLAYPLMFVLGLMLMLGCWLQLSADRRRWLGVALIAGAVWPLGKIGGLWVLLGFGAAGALAFVLPHRWLRDASASLTRWARTLPTRYREARQRAAAERWAELQAQPQDGRARRRRMWRNAWRATVAVALVITAWMLTGKLLALLVQLTQPLAG